jgi:hypothetical protein
MYPFSTLTFVGYARKYYTLSHGEKERYWRCLARSNKRRVIEVVSKGLQDVKAFNHKHYRLMVNELRLYLHVFDAGTRAALYNSYFRAEEKLNKRLARNYEFQAGFTESLKNYIPSLPITHSIDNNTSEVISKVVDTLNSVMTGGVPLNIGINKSVYSNFVQLIVALTSMCVATTHRDRFLILITYLSGFVDAGIIDKMKLYVQPLFRSAKLGEVDVASMYYSSNSSEVDSNDDSCDFANNYVFQAEGDFCPKATETLVQAFMSYFRNLFDAKDKFDISLDKARVDRIAGLSRMVNSVATLISYVYKCIKIAFKYIYEKMTGRKWYSSKSLEIINDVMPNWINRVMVLKAVHDSESLPFTCANDLTMQRIATQLFDEGNKLYKILASDNTEVKRVADTFKRLLDPLYEIATTNSINHVKRVRPFMLYLAGAPGVGKSMLTDFFTGIYGMHQQLIDNADEAHKLLYVRQAKNEHWDGYREQPVCLIDDVYQSRESTDKEAESMDIINMGNNAPYPLLMAKCEEKGKAFFRSRLIMLTSNEEIHRDIGIIEPFAVYRRFNICATVENTGPVAPLDLKKLQFTVWKVTSMSRAGNATREQIGVFNLEEFIQYFKSAIDDHEQKEILIMNRNKRYLQEFIDGTREDSTESQDDSEVPKVEEANRTSCTSYHIPGVVHNPFLWDLIMNGKHDDEPADPEWLSEVVAGLHVQKKELFVVPSELRTRISEMTAKLATGVATTLDEFRKDITSAIDSSPVLKAIVLSMSVMSFFKVIDLMSSLVVGKDSKFHPHLFESGEEEYQKGERKNRGMGMNKKAYKAAATKEAFNRYINTVRGREEGLNNETKSSEAYLSSMESLAGNLKQSCGFNPMFWTKVPTSAELERREFDALLHKASAMKETLNTLEQRMEKLASKHIADATGNGADGKFESEHNLAPVGEQTVEELSTSVVRKMVPWSVDDSRRAKLNSARKCQFEGCVDTCAQELIRNKVSKNCFEITLMQSEGTYKNQCLFLFATAFVTNYHFYAAIPRDEVVMLRFASVSHSEAIPSSAIEWCKVDENNDLAYGRVKVKSGFPSRPDIRKFLLTNDDLKNVNAITSGTLVKYCPGISGPYTTNATEIVPLSKKQCIQVGSIVTLVNGFRYTASTLSGDCGSALVINLPSLQSRRVAGIHAAGKPGANVGGATLLTYEGVIEAYQNHTDFILQFDYESLPHKPNDIFPYDYCDDDHNYEIIGDVPDELQIRVPTKHSLVKSPIFEAIASTTVAPSLLRKVGDVNPMKNGVYKYFKELVGFPQEVLDEIRHDMFYEFTDNVKSTYNEVLPYSVVINGVMDDPWLRPLNFKSSAGWPWVHFTQGMPGKTAFFVFQEYRENGQPLFRMNDELEKAVIERDMLAQAGISAPTILSDNLKPEKRPLAKVESGKTRVFVTMPLDYNIVFRKYFLGFTAHIMENNTKLEPAIGINPHSIDWQMMLERFEEVGDADSISYVAGDFGTYDGNMHGQLIQAVVKLVNDWYNDSKQNKLARETLIKDIWSPVHVNGKTLYRVFHGNPSGNPFTAVMNSIVNTFYMRYCFITLGKPYGYGLSSYHMFVRAKSYGDDNLLSVNNKVAHFYNQIEISKLLALHGVEYTSASKEEVETPFTHRDQITFLKRSFAWHSDLGRVTAPLDFITICEMTNWIRNKLPPKDAMLLNAQCVLREMVYYGPALFKQMRDSLRYALANADISTATLPTYLELLFSMRTTA